MRDLTSHDRDDRFIAALCAIDTANADDPSDVHGTPLALFEGQRAHQWVVQLEPFASEPLQLAARAHHLRRWVVPRASYPEGRAAYLRWRRDQKLRHAEELSLILTDVGYDVATIERAKAIVAKHGLGTDDEVQLFEDAVALTFLESQVVSTRERLGDDDKMVGVLAKTLTKMSPRGRDAAGTVTFDDDVAGLITRAVDSVAGRH